MEKTKTNTLHIEHPVECEARNNQVANETFGSLFKYLVLGIFFGIVFVKAEIVSWYRIQEMFSLHSFHMYGIISTAVMVGMIYVLIIKKINIRTTQNETVVFPTKKFQ